MEVVYDLDFEASKVAEEIGINMVRARTAGTHPSFVKMIRELDARTHRQRTAAFRWLTWTKNERLCARLLSR